MTHRLLKSKGWAPPQMRRRLKPLKVGQVDWMDFHRLQEHSTDRRRLKRLRQAGKHVLALVRTSSCLPVWPISEMTIERLGMSPPI